MNAAAVLALIAELYEAADRLKVENSELRKALTEVQAAPPV